MSQPTASPSPTPSCNVNGLDNCDFEERYLGTISRGQSSVLIRVVVRRHRLETNIKQDHGNQTIYFDVLDPNGNLIATADGDEIDVDILAPGDYFFRVRGNVTKAVDSYIKSKQSN